MTTRQPSKAPTPRQAYLVLGMHRSGTSALTQLLALAGANLPRNVMPGDEHNAKGYFEPWKVAVLNDERLRAGGSAWDDIFAFPFKPLPLDEDQPWRAKIGDLFMSEYGKVKTPLLKDPRVTVLFPLWRSMLEDAGVQPLCVIPVRSPLAVAGSLSRRNGFPVEKSVLLWSAYMLAAEAYTRDLPRVFVSYDALLADWRTEVARMEIALGAPFPKMDEAAAKAIDKFLTPELRHNDGAGALASLGWAGALAAEVESWFDAAAQGRPPGLAPLEKAGETLADRGREFGMLVSPVTSELDALRAELADVRGRLQAERDALAAALETDRQLLEKGWRDDVQGWQSRYRILEKDVGKLEYLSKSWAEVDAKLDTILADTER